MACCAVLCVLCAQLKKILSANAEAPLNIECIMDDKDVRVRHTHTQFAVHHAITRITRRETWGWRRAGGGAPPAERRNQQAASVYRQRLSVWGSGRGCESRLLHAHALMQGSLTRDQLETLAEPLGARLKVVLEKVRGSC